MNPFRALRRFAAMSPSRRWQWLVFMRDRLVTRAIYIFRLRQCGKGTIVQKPLFWTPEFIELGERVLIWRDCRIEGLQEYGGVSYEPNIKLGNEVSLQQSCHITAADKITIGDGTSLMYGVLVTDIDHDYAAIDVNILAQNLSVSRTEIGRNCFVGAGARIQAGTRLGDQCIVGANAVVRGAFPDHCVIVGVPARIVKRYDAATDSWRRTNAEGEFLQ